MVELLDLLYPYGSKRISWSFTASEAETQKTYIGEYSDDESGLSYLNARYYDPERRTCGKLIEIIQETHREKIAEATAKK